MVDRYWRPSMSVPPTPEELARTLAASAVACTDADVADRLLQTLRYSQAIGSPGSPEPLEVFARAGGVQALASAMKANTPVAADWPEGVRPAPTLDLADVQKEGCGVLNNLAASALAGSAVMAEALREAALVPLLVSTVDAYCHRADVMHRVLPALAQLASIVKEAVDESQAEAIGAVVKCMQAATIPSDLAASRV